MSTIAVSGTDCNPLASPHILGRVALHPHAVALPRPDSRDVRKGRIGMKPSQIGHAARGQIQYQVAKSTVDTCWRDTTLMSSDDDIFVIGGARGWVENRLLTAVNRTLTGSLGRHVLHSCGGDV